MDLASTLERLSFADPSAPPQWVRAIHSAFYAPATRGQSGNKFLELETTLTQVLTTKLHEQQQQKGDAGGDGQDELWASTVRVVLLLAQEPAATDTASAAVAEDSGDTLAAQAYRPALSPTGASTNTSAQKKGAAGKKATKKSKKSAQPYAPLAFVVVNALKKLVGVAGDDTAESFREHGRTNADLTAFCLRGFEHPEEVVSTTACKLVSGELHAQSLTSLSFCAFRTKSCWWKSSRSSTSCTLTSR